MLLRCHSLNGIKRLFENVYAMCNEKNKQIQINYYTLINFYCDELITHNKICTQHTTVNGIDCLFALLFVRKITRKKDRTWTKVENEIEMWMENLCPITINRADRPMFQWMTHTQTHAAHTCAHRANADVILRTTREYSWNKFANFFGFETHIIYASALFISFLAKFSVFSQCFCFAFLLFFLADIDSKY